MIQRLALAAVLTFLLATTAVAGVHFLPDATSDQVSPRSTRALLTWELPEGLLVVDRRGPEQPSPGGEELTPRFEDAEWYLVDRSHAAGVDPAAFGHVHLSGETAWVIEVPRARLDAFLSAALRIQYLDLSPLAPAQVPPAAKSDLAQPTVDPDLKAAYVDALDQQAYNQLLREITGDVAFWYNGGPYLVTTRYYNTAGNDVVANYLAAKLAGYGYTVELDAFTASGHLCHNVVATLPGTVLLDEIVVVGGHFDSTSEEAGTNAPGAEDNASGTSLVMEVARVSAGLQFERTVQFVLFDAEEIGLRGSQHFVDEAVAEGRDIVAAITADMVAYYDDNYGVIIEGQTQWEWLMTAMADNVIALTDIAYNKTYYSWGSDHVPFQQAGIAAFLAIDQDWEEYPYYHQTSDTWAHVEGTVPIALQISRAAAGTLADVAGLMDGTTEVPEAGVPLVRLRAWPNPFNPQTTITFSLERDEWAEVGIYELTGRRVAVLADRTFDAGTHSLTWSGCDEAGRAMPSGTYLVRLETESAVRAQKLMLLR